MTETERLVIRPWQVVDAEKLTELVKCTKPQDFLPIQRFANAVEARDYIINRLSTATHFAVADKATRELIGGVELAMRRTAAEGPAEGPDAYFDFWISPSKQHQGYGDEMIDAVVAYAFTTLNARSVWCRMTAANYVAHNVLLQHGFLPEDQYSRAFSHPDDKNAPDFLYLTAEDWKKRING
ncbi:MAG: GNAT family N-acetyltransferase [Paludibacteraceae bacterium]|nr:GNAT family N-acetyltransferase [Paludibacteraceae bacterium]